VLNPIFFVKKGKRKAEEQHLRLMVAKSDIAWSGCGQRICSVALGTHVCEVLFVNTKLRKCLRVALFSPLPLGSIGCGIIFSVDMAL